MKTFIQIKSNTSRNLQSLTPILSQNRTMVHGRWNKRYKKSPGTYWHSPERMLAQTLGEQKHTKAYKSTRAHYMKTHTGPTPYV